MSLIYSAKPEKKPFKSKAMLTAKQKAFIEAYTGNATEAAKIAGYSEATAYSIGQRLLKQHDVATTIRARET